MIGVGLYRKQVYFLNTPNLMYGLPRTLEYHSNCSLMSPQCHLFTKFEVLWQFVLTLAPAHRSWGVGWYCTTACGPGFSNYSLSVCGGWPMTQGTALLAMHGGGNMWAHSPMQERLLPASWKPGSHWQEKDPGTLTQRCWQYRYRHSSMSDKSEGGNSGELHIQLNLLFFISAFIKTNIYSVERQCSIS